MDYAIHITTLVCIFGILAISLDILAGQAGLLSLAQTAFFGIGAYLSTLLSIRGVNFTSSFLIAVTGACIASLLLAILCSRLHGDLLTIATFSFQIVFTSIATNWIDVTGGSTGLAGIPRPSFGAFIVETRYHYLTLAVIALVLVYWLVHRTTTRPIGRVFHGLRENETLMQALGKNTQRFKINAFILSGGIAAAAGVLYAHYTMFIDPTSFTATETLFVLSMVIVGGTGSSLGAVLGALILVTTPEALRFLGLPSAVAANLRQIIYSSLIVIFLIFRPQGLIGNYVFRR